MRFQLTVLPGAFAALAAACAVPFNDVRLLHNKTLLHEAIEQHRQAQARLPNGPQTGWAHAVQAGNPYQPWPDDLDGIVRVRYCYRSAKVEADLKPSVDKGWRLWQDRLGEAGAASGHALEWVRYSKDGRFPPCRVNDEPVDASTWNPEVPFEIVEVASIEDVFYEGRATVGYLAPKWWVLVVLLWGCG